MHETADFTALFTPFELAGKRLRNRITHASMTTLLATPAGRVTERLIQYHANRAAGGAAMTVTEPLGMMRHQAGLPRVQVWRRDDADGLKRFAEAVEGQDCRLLGQIQDAGRGRHYPGRNPEAIGASALPDDLSWTVPRALTGARHQRAHRADRRIGVAPEGVWVFRRGNLGRARASVPPVSLPLVQPAGRRLRRRLGRPHAHRRRTGRGPARGVRHGFHHRTEAARR